MWAEFSKVAARAFPANVGSILFLDWRVRSGCETVAARCRRIGQGRFAIGRPPIGNPRGSDGSDPFVYQRATAKYRGCRGRALLRHYQRKTPRPYLRICPSGFCLILSQNRSVRMAQHSLENALDRLWLVQSLTNTRARQHIRFSIGHAAPNLARENLNIAKLLKKWSEWQDLNLRPPRPERGKIGFPKS